MLSDSQSEFAFRSYLLLLLFTSSVLLQVLTLMKDEVILLQESFSALGTHVRAKCAASIWMPLVVEHKTVLSYETLSAELTEMGLGLLLRRRRNLNDRRLLVLILLLLLCDLNRLLLDRLLLNLSRALLLILVLMVDLDLLMLLVAMVWTLKNLIDDFTVRRDDLHWDW